MLLYHLYYIYDSLKADHSYPFLLSNISRTSFYFPLQKEKIKFFIRNFVVVVYTKADVRKG